MNELHFPIPTDRQVDSLNDFLVEKLNLPCSDPSNYPQIMHIEEFCWNDEPKWFVFMKPFKGCYTEVVMKPNFANESILEASSYEIAGHGSPCMAKQVWRFEP